MALGVESEFVGSQLKNAGIYGAITSVLLSTIGGLVLYIRFLLKDARKVYGYRLSERDTYNQALSESKAAILTQAEAARERNKVIEEIARAISASTAQGATLNALLQLQFEVIKEDHARAALVLTALSESVRTLAQSSSNIQTVVAEIPDNLRAMQAHIDSVMSRRS